MAPPSPFAVNPVAMSWINKVVEDLRKISLSGMLTEEDIKSWMSSKWIDFKILFGDWLKEPNQAIYKETQWKTKFLNRLRNEKSKIDKLMEHLDGDENALRAEGLGPRMNKTQTVYSVESEDLQDGGEYQVGINNGDESAEENNNYAKLPHVDDQIPDNNILIHTANAPHITQPIEFQAENPTKKQSPSSGSNFTTIPSSPISNIRQLAPFLQAPMGTMFVPVPEGHGNYYGAPGMNRVGIHEETRKHLLDSANSEKIAKHQKNFPGVITKLFNDLLGTDPNAEKSLGTARLHLLYAFKQKDGSSETGFVSAGCSSLPDQVHNYELSMIPYPYEYNIMNPWKRFCNEEFNQSKKRKALPTSMDELESLYNQDMSTNISFNDVASTSSGGMSYRCRHVKDNRGALYNTLHKESDDMHYIENNSATYNPTIEYDFE